MKPRACLVAALVLVLCGAWAAAQQVQQVQQALPNAAPNAAAPNAAAPKAAAPNAAADAIQQAGFKAGKSGELANLPLPDPEPFTTKDGRKGWKIKIPGGRPLATPAIAAGVLYVGGGFGSHEFYALDAATGKRVWTFKTGDDGPTAAVVAEDCVVYNTESCTIYIQDARTGKVLWDKWLGDPLMSQPAIGGGRLFMAYPGQGGHRLVAFELKTGKVIWEAQIDAEVITAPVLDGDCCCVSTCAGTVYCFDQAGGKLYWKKEVSATSAPVLLGGKVYFSQRQVKTIEVAEGEGKDAKKVKSEMTFEGFNAADAKSGELAFAKPQSAVKAGYLLSLDLGRQQYAMNNAVNVLAQKRMLVGAGGAADVIRAASQPAGGAGALGAEDVLARLDAYRKRTVSDKPEDGPKAADEARGLSDDLDKVAASLQAKSGQAEAAKELKQSASELRAQADKVQTAAETSKDIAANLKAGEKEAAAAQKHDTSVAFAAAPAAAQLGKASANIGQANVKSVWAFQGSRPLAFGDSFVVIQGDQFRCVSRDGKTVAWENKLVSKVDATRPGTPPAMAGGKVYFGTADGRIVCADPRTGRALWESEVGGHILFQPAVVGGRVYVATDDGSLICLDAGDPKADGWTMWGGSAGHNGPTAAK